jgi:hypothetical protein
LIEEKLPNHRHDAEISAHVALSKGNVTTNVFWHAWPPMPEEGGAVLKIAYFFDL